MVKKQHWFKEWITIWPQATKAEWKYIIFVTDNNDNKRHLNLVQKEQ